MALHESSRGCTVIDRSKLSMLTTEFLELRSRRLSSIGKPEAIFDRVDILYQPGTDYERWLDPENCIAPQILVPVQEEMRDKRAISRCTDHEVNMCRPERMAPHRREQLTGGTVLGNGITHSHSGPEAEAGPALAEQTTPHHTARALLTSIAVHLMLAAV